MDAQQQQEEVDGLSEKEKAVHFKKYINDKISSYYHRSALNSVVHNTLQIIILVGAACVPFLLNIPSVPKLVSTIISGVVAGAAALANYYKFGERSRIDRLTAQGMRQEYNCF